MSPDVRRVVAKSLTAIHAWYVFRCVARRAAVRRVARALDRRGFQPVLWTEACRDAGQVEVYAGRAAEASEAAAVAQSVLPAGASAGICRRLRNRDWCAEWKRSFRALRVGRIVIRPSWQSHRRRRGDVVLTLDPGMAFGTGQHATTRACLALLDGLAKAGTGGRVLDLGCGSGILAIAAAKLGFSPVLAVDNDPVAARVAEANARRNRVTGIVTVHGGDVRRLPARPCYDVVVANILSGVLRDNAARIACAVRPDALGRLIVAGILRRQYPAVRRAFEAQGFREVRRIDEDNWSAGLFERSDYGETGRTTATVQSAQKPAAGTPRATSPRPRRRPRPRSRRAMQSHA